MRPRLVLSAFAAVILLISFAGHGQASACEIVVVQSSEIRPFQEAFSGFEEASGCSIKEIFYVSSGSSDILARVRRLNPDGIFAIGLDALERVQQIRDIPIFYTMAANLPRSMQSAANISGVSMIVAPERQLEAIRLLLPKAGRIGVIYDPAVSGHFVEDLVRAGRAVSIEIVARKVRGPKDVGRGLDELRGKVDALLMLPGLTVVTPETVEAMLLFSFRNSVPVISFSEKYVAMGALASVVMAPADLGRQTGELAMAYFSGKTGGRHIRSYARKGMLIINKKIADKFGIHLSSEALKKGIRVE